MDPEFPVTWQKVIDSIDLPISVHDRHHVVRLANAAFLKALKRSSEEVIGRRCHELAHCADEPLVGCPHAALLESGEPVEREFLSPDESKAVGISCFPVRDDSGVLLGSVHMVRDVTSVARLRERWERRSASLAGHLEVLRTFLKEPGRLDRVGSIPFPNENMAPCYEVRGCEHGDCSFRQGDGLRCWHGCRSGCQNTSLTDPADRLLACQECEVYKRATPDDLSALAELFNDLVYLLQVRQVEAVQAQRTATVGELSAMLAHEIRTPLNSLSLQVQMAHRRMRGQDDPQFAEMKQVISALSEDVRRLDQVVQRFAEAARRPQGEGRLTRLGPFLDEVCASLRALAREKDIDLVLECPTPRYQVTGVLVDLLRICGMNLLLNAVEATGSGCHILLRCEARDGWLTLLVQDDGPGIPLELRGKVFEPFFTTRAEGTGLGLAMVAHVVKRAAGTITLEDNEGSGTRFVVRAPLPAAR